MSGYSPQELDDFSRTLGIRFPPTLREWWRLAGRHPFVESPSPTIVGDIYSDGEDVIYFWLGG